MDIFEIRLVNKITGVADVVLGDAETWQVSPVISDAGTAQFTYPRNGVNWALIQTDKDIAFFQQGVEIGTLRSTIEQISYDDANLNEEGDIATCTCRTSMARLARAVVYPSGWPTKTDPPNVTFTGATPGYILRTLVQAAQSRGTIPEINISSFSDTLDSNGVPWASTISIQWNAQTSYLQIINDLQSYGLADAIMNVYTLKLYNYQTLGVDRTLATAPPIMRKGRDLTQSSFQGSTRNLTTVTLASGSNNLYVESQDSGAVATYGRREGGTSASGVTDATQLGQIGLQYTKTLSSEVDARTNALNFAHPSTPMPGRDFDLGDWMWTDIDGTLHRQRAIQWSLAMDSQGVASGTAAMDSIFGEFLTRLQAQVNGIESGATIVGSSTVSPVKKITSPPQVPSGLTVGSTAYIDNQGHTFAYTIASWAAVTQDQSGNPTTNVAGYQIQIKYHTNTDWMSFSTDSGTLSLYHAGLLPGASIDTRVQCVDTQGNLSGWSSVVTITTATDVTPPNQPSTPVMSSQLGQLSIKWDGLDSGGLGMPSDFDHTTVYVSSSSPTFTPSSLNSVGTLKTAGNLTVPGAGLVYGTTYYARFIAYDQSGNASTASAAGSAVLAQVVATDITTGQVSLANVAFSDVGNLINNGSFEDPVWQATYNTLFGGTHFALDPSTSSAGSMSVVHTGTGGQVNETVVMTTIQAKTGQVFMGAADFKVSTDTVPGMRVALGVNFLDINSNNLGYTDLAFCFTSPSTNDNTWRSRIASQAAQAPAGTVTAQFVLASHLHTAGKVWMDNVEVRMQIDTLILADLAVTNAKINDLSVNKLTAGTLNAAIILGNNIATSSSGARVMMDGPSDSLYTYDNSANLIGAWSGLPGTDPVAGVSHPAGWSIFNDPGPGYMQVISHTPGGTWLHGSPTIVVSSDSSQSTTEAQIYSNSGIGWETLRIDSSISQPSIDSSLSQVWIEMNGAFATNGAQGHLVYNNSAGSCERIMWDHDGLTVDQGYPGTPIKGRPLQHTGIQGGGLEYRFITWNVVAPTTDSSGHATFSHGAPFTPTFILATDANGSNRNYYFDNITATTARVTVYNANGTLAASTLVNFWMGAVGDH